ncbi:hypothetical protein ABFW11_29380 [Mycolicibacterium porcinum]
MERRAPGLDRLEAPVAMYVAVVIGGCAYSVAAIVLAAILAYRNTKG